MLIRRVAACQIGSVQIIMTRRATLTQLTSAARRTQVNSPCKSIAYQGYSLLSDPCATKYTGRSVSLKVPAFDSLP